MIKKERKTRCGAI